MVPTSSWLDRTLWPAIALLATVLVFFQLSNADIVIQDRLYDFHTGKWLVDRFAWWPAFWFHKFPKYLIILFAVILILRIHAVPRWNRLRWLRPSPVREGWIVLLCLALTPLIVAIGKNTTNVHCPWDIERYGGREPYVKTWSGYDPAHPPTKCGACWPAGHASGGFALFALASLAATRRGQVLGTLTGLTAGGVMGAYQMLKGAHYLSDTLVTALLAWIIHLLLRRGLGWKAMIATQWELSIFP
jgi:membrane-associated PAP2 superfamily phosphatase